MEQADFRISVSKFRASCPELFDRLQSGNLKRIIVSRRGQAVAVVSAPVAHEAANMLFGCLRGSVRAPRGFDFTRSILNKPRGAQHVRIKANLSFTSFLRKQEPRGK